MKGSGREVADERMQQALAASGRADPRPRCREILRELKEQKPTAYRDAVGYFEEQLVSAIAARGADPLEEWLEYSRLLVEMTVPGSTVQIDPSGLSQPYQRPVPGDHLVLHLPTSYGDPVTVLAEPADPSPAQRATCDLLVARKLG